MREVYLPLKIGKGMFGMMYVCTLRNIPNQPFVCVRFVEMNALIVKFFGSFY